MEKWKDIPNYEGLYQVSNLGNIRSLTFRNNKVNKKRKKPLLMKYSTRSGYYNVNWSICNMKHRKSITNTNTGKKYIYYRESTKKYRIVIDKKEYKNCLTLEEAIKKRDEILNEKV